MNPNRKQFRIIASSGIFILTYLSAFFLYQILTAFFAYTIGNLESFSFFKINFKIHYDNWNTIKIIYVFGIPTVILVTLGSIIQKLVNTNPAKNVLDIFLLWFCINVFSLLAAQFFVSFFYLSTEIEYLNKGFSNIVSWMNIGTIPILFLTLIVSVLLCIKGYKSGIIFFSLYLPHKPTNSDILTPGSNYFIEIFMAPVMLGSIPLLLIQSRETAYFHFFYLFSYTLWGMGLFFIKKNIPLRFKKVPDVIKSVPIYIPIIALIICTLLYFL